MLTALLVVGLIAAVAATVILVIAAISLTKDFFDEFF